MLGPFFFTLSCADQRWDENFTSLLEGHDVTFTNLHGEENVFVDGQTLDDFLAAYPSKHNMVKTNLLNATLNFQNRLKQFIKKIVLNKMGSLPAKYYNYRIEFQFRGAPHAHGVLWIDWESIPQLSQAHKNNFIEAKNLIRNCQKLSAHHLEAMEKVADLAISVSLRNPAVSDLVKDVQLHRHTAKACKKYGTQCRFNFPKFPIHKTIISIPSNYAFDDEKEKTEKMKRYSQVIDAVKEVLEDDEKMKKICSFKQNELDKCTEASKIKYRLNLLLENADYQKKKNSHVPEDLQ